MSTGVSPGVYDVQAEATGLAKVLNQGATLVTATTATINFELRVATTSQTAEVTSVAPDRVVDIGAGGVDIRMRDSAECLQDIVEGVDTLPYPAAEQRMVVADLIVPSYAGLPISNRLGNGRRWHDRIADDQTYGISLGGGSGFGGGAGRNGAGESAISP